MPYTTLDLLTETYQDLTILAVGQTLDADQSAFGLLKLARLFDNWNAERAGVYANRFITDTLVSGLNPHTIGPDTATFTVAQRPVTVDGVSLVLPSSADVFLGLNPRNAAWYSSLTVPGIETDIPTDFYYNPTWPNGEIWLYPVPDADYDVRLLTRVVLADLALSDTVSLPPGYRDAIILTLGEMIALTYPPAVPSPEAAAAARARIFANNDVLPTLETADAGLTARGGRFFNWRSGLMQP